jgi:hypothetical protein
MDVGQAPTVVKSVLELSMMTGSELMTEACAGDDIRKTMMIAVINGKTNVNQRCG